ATWLIRTRPEEAEERIEAAIGDARRAVTEGREAVQGLRSSTVLTNDFTQAIGAFGMELSSQVKAGPEFSISGDGETRDLPPLGRDEIYRIACEATRNSFTHAEATQVEVEIHYEQRRFRMLVRDNGKGIEPHILDAGHRDGHHGLPGMRERATLVG